MENNCKVRLLGRKATKEQEVQVSQKSGDAGKPAPLCPTLVLGEVKERERVVVYQHPVGNLLRLGDILHKETEYTRGLAYYPQKVSRSLQFGK